METTRQSCNECHKESRDHGEGVCFWCGSTNIGLIDADTVTYTLRTTNPLDIPVSSAELQSVLDYLLDLAEKHYPGYSGDSEIAFINDFYKKHLG